MSKLREEIVKANEEHKLEFMFAKDLFKPDEYTQIFSAKTGKYIGTIKHGQKIPLEEPDEIPPTISEEENRNQLSLF